MKNKVKIAASLICGDPLNLKDEIIQLHNAETDLLHFDVMDGLFVPRYGLYPEILTYLKKVTNIPVDVHMMVSNPEDYIDDFSKAGADYYNVHVESTIHLHRVVKKVRDYMYSSLCVCKSVLPPGTVYVQILYLSTLVLSKSTCTEPAVCP